MAKEKGRLHARYGFVSSYRKYLRHVCKIPSPAYLKRFVPSLPWRIQLQRCLRFSPLPFLGSLHLHSKLPAFHAGGRLAFRALSPVHAHLSPGVAAARGDSCASSSPCPRAPVCLIAWTCFSEGLVFSSVVGLGWWLARRGLNPPLRPALHPRYGKTV